jgi:glutamate N-acetyltransferase/amino-acid N-acetyltransferase
MNTEKDSDITFVQGGVCAPKGFAAAGLHAGFKKTKKDLAVIVSERDCAAAAVYTTNKVKGAPLLVTQRHLRDGKARAIVCNSGNANTCAPGGKMVAERTCAMMGESFHIPPTDVIVCSTGVIGKPLPIEPFQRGIPKLAAVIFAGDSKGKYFGSVHAAEAIKTTDKVVKETAVSFELGGKTCYVGGISKGSGMINPNMATMLAFLTTDVAIDAVLLRELLKQDVETSFNRISIDGDTSTNDTAVLLANGMAGNRKMTAMGEDAAIFARALNAVTTTLSRAMAKDGEGATKLIECVVSGAPDVGVARTVGKTVIQSDLVKTAIFGCDANWGRILCAVGYAKGHFSVNRTDVALSSRRGTVRVCEHSTGLAFDEVMAKEILKEDEIRIDINLNSGTATATSYGCDLTYGYVRINGMYRT